MTIEECFTEIKRLEAKLMRFTPRTDEDREFWNYRRAGIFESVERFDVAVLHKAFNLIVEEAADDEKSYFPTVPEILAAIRSVEEASVEKPKAKRARYLQAKHKCAKGHPEKNAALATLAALSIYEARHVLCPPDVPATCPGCGRRRIETGIFDELKKIYPPAMTEGWNFNFKGLLACEECDKDAR